MLLTKRSELLALLRLAAPLVASQLAHILMVLTDTLMMARLSPEALAGGGLGAASYSFVSIFCFGVIAAVGTLVAIRHGAGDTEGVARLTRAGLWLAWLLAGIGALLLWSLKPLLLALGQTPENVENAGHFLLLLPLALPGAMTFMALRGFTSAVGKAWPVMIISLMGAGLNAVLNLALINGWMGLPKLGLLGIGLVTAIVANAMAGALWLLLAKAPAYRGYCIGRGLARPDWPSIRELWHLGLPIGGTYAVEVGLFAYAALCIGTLGSVQLAAHQIALQIVSVAFMVPVGLSYAVTLRVGHHYGAGSPRLARQAGWVGIGFGAAIMLCFAAAFWAIPATIIGLFIDARDPAFAPVFALAMSLLAIAAWFELFDGVQTIAMGALRGLKESRLTFFIGLCCYWLIGAPTAWWLAFHAGWGAQGVWWGLAAGLACAAASLCYGFIRRIRRWQRRAPGADTATAAPSAAAG
ncbi:MULTISPECIES: NorM family multidrug efflux MATE transporter [unclassified Pseudomonas]|uniref:NorM family multidrug efflux MATE transporter n=1 Tax=unclassified Pseudomonas TaxID=196821 RepID=UPI000BCDAA5F|nr:MULTISPECIES: NorM family multidrug efflux MATE transporter [unclassified Pseudomonas]PVZ15346.1 MATE family multidrug resistance protein [Pseudomonas sp. URIL14HWK12:I12]PVZ24720.1 MATE family multidrug resistance protein [Pseudomonas sp. URIL14HWK12:I10]PVZ34565.1 MATE family multidrug resistance protein [Pseudomonas sp. URIL14HWK12:I11]SNZ08670.1 multidrug resistance protein, MATE family [Pseudomonas sp. URIL14HWK12:I9]